MWRLRVKIVRINLAPASHRHEHHPAQFAPLELLFAAPRDADQFLIDARSPHRYHQATANRQLLAQRVGDCGSSGRNHDAVIGPRIWPTQRAIIPDHADIAIAQFGEPVAGAGGKAWMALDRHHLSAQFGKQRRDIARPGADFEHAMIGLRPDGLKHLGHDQRLGNGLPVPQRQGAVGIGIGMACWRHEPFAWYLGHGGQHAAVADLAGEELQHLLAHLVHGGHGAFRKAAD